MDINKDKLLKELPCCTDGHCIGSKCKHFTSFSTCIVNAIKNFPEEPAIDFDALYYKWRSNPIDGLNPVESFKDFLKSKNLTQQKQRDIPVKKAWSLKEKYKPLLAEYGILVTDEKEELPLNIVEFYDLKEEIDYSAIPKGSIVEFKDVYENKAYRKFIEYEGSRFIVLKDCSTQIQHWQKHNFVRVVEWAKEVIN